MTVSPFLRTFRGQWVQSWHPPKAAPLILIIWMLFEVPLVSKMFYPSSYFIRMYGCIAVFTLISFKGESFSVTSSLKANMHQSVMNIFICLRTRWGGEL